MYFRSGSSEEESDLFVLGISTVAMGTDYRYEEATVFIKQKFIYFRCFHFFHRHDFFQDELSNK